MLAGKRIVVTGAAGGLGSVLVATLLRAGAQVCGLIRDDADARRMTDDFAGQTGLTALVADLADADGVERSLAADIARNGAFYGLVNNAAIYPKALAAELEAGEIAAVLAVNVVGAATMARACIPGMKEAGEGRIVNIASNTFDTGMEELGAYVASKGALIGLVRVWARELGRFGITANAVSPGAFQTDAEKIHPDSEAYSVSIIAQQAIKRRGDPREFAELVAFLLGPSAGFITGQTVRIDGGVVTQ